MSIKRCKRSFFCRVDGRQRLVPLGELVSSEDPVVKGREHLFEDADEYVEAKAARRSGRRRAPVVEQATAEPGERRTVRRVRKLDAPVADD